MFKKPYQQAGADIRTENLPSGLREKSMKSVGISALSFPAGRKFFPSFCALRLSALFLRNFNRCGLILLFFLPLPSRMYCSPAVQAVFFRRKT